MDRINLRKLPKEEQVNFFQSKYEYYKSFNLRMITVTSLAYLSFFITDCQIFGRFAYETVPARFAVLIPFLIYLILSKKVADYRIMVPATYLMIHIIIWGTCLATYMLPDRQFAIPGMIIMNLIFVCAGFAAPISYSVIAQMVLVADIAVADVFIQYENINMMYMFNLPCIVAIVAMHCMMQRVYFDHYVVLNRLQNLIVHDQLTGVYNRNILKEIYDNNTGGLVYGSDILISMLLIDVDYFKKINDGYGHEAGDKVLVHIAGILQQGVRNTDYVIRWGGEEFLIIMPGCNSEKALQIAERLRSNVEQSDNGICRTTISVGCALYADGDYHDTIKKADEAMYQAKREGRNQVITYEMLMSK